MIPSVVNSEIRLEPWAPGPGPEEFRHLSPGYAPFLPGLIAEAVRAGAGVFLVPGRATIRALVVDDPVESTASVFTAEAEVAAELVRAHRGWTFSEHAIDRPRERFDLYARDPLGDDLPGGYRHRVDRLGPEHDLAARTLVREAYPHANDRYFATARGGSAAGFGVWVNGTLAGAGWATAAGSTARLHGLTVRPGFRHIGVGADLVRARLEWGRWSGAARAFSEISERNAASRAIAERLGMRPDGCVYLYHTE